jgi:hypothetical protein
VPTRLPRGYAARVPRVPTRDTLQLLTRSFPGDRPRSRLIGSAESALISHSLFFFFVRLTVQNTEFRHGLVAQHLSLMTRLPGKLLRSCCIMADMAQSATPGLTRSFPGCVVISRLDTDPNVNFFRHDKHAGELIDRGGSEFCSRLPSFRLHQLKQIPPPSHEYTLRLRHFL